MNTVSYHIRRQHNTRIIFVFERTHFPQKPHGLFERLVVYAPKLIQFWRGKAMWNGGSTWQIRRGLEGLANITTKCDVVLSRGFVSVTKTESSMIESSRNTWGNESSSKLPPMRHPSTPRLVWCDLKMINDPKGQNIVAYGGSLWFLGFLVFVPPSTPPVTPSNACENIICSHVCRSWFIRAPEKNIVDDQNRTASCLSS